MTEMIDSKDNGSDQQLGSAGLAIATSQLTKVLAEMEAEEQRCAKTRPLDDHLPDTGDDLS
jgi:hypothetical protein